ncbi:hypothetical protein EC973_002326 [Apophysomyces ossiformis]|uniref:Uncharacterized protein n=1 Tax=Apophysomyces ossiformis TaxID=679940 RepID=A0A8H7BMU4_9FUNG|nr:hypothetical protein EC973_002326 [Apophysomyces ossiformis]
MTGVQVNSSDFQKKSQSLGTVAMNNQRLYACIPTETISDNRRIKAKDGDGATIEILYTANSTNTTSHQLFDVVLRKDPKNFDSQKCEEARMQNGADIGHSSLGSMISRCIILAAIVTVTTYAV